MSHYFATPDEIGQASTLVRIDEAIRCLNQGGSLEEATRLCPAGGPVIYERDGDAYVSGDDSHSIAFASTGRGKSRRLVFPTIITEILSGTSIVVNDMKGEIYAGCKDLLSLAGYTTYIIDLRHPRDSPNRFNPLLLAWDEWHAGESDAAFRHLRSFGSSLFSGQRVSGVDPFWADSSTDYFVGLATGALEAGIARNAFTLESIAAMDLLGERPAKVGYEHSNLERMFSFFPATSRALQSVSGTLSAPDRTRQSIRSTFRQPITLYVSQDGLMDALCRSDFAVADLSRERTALFIISPDESRAFGPIVVGILNQIMSGLITYAQDVGGTLPHRVDFIIDEMGNLPTRIPDLEALVSAARSRNIRLHLVLQSIDQLTSVYGPELTNVIVDNCDTLVFMGSKGLPFLRYVSELAGTVRLESGEERPLLSVDKLQRLEKRADKTEALVFLSSLRPYIVPLKDYSRYERPDARAETGEPSKEAVSREVFDIAAVRRSDIVGHKKRRDLMHREGEAPRRAEEDSAYDVQAEIERRFDELFGPSESEGD